MPPKTGRTLESAVDRLRLTFCAAWSTLEASQCTHRGRFVELSWPRGSTAMPLSVPVPALRLGRPPEAPASSQPPSAAP